MKKKKIFIGTSGWYYEHWKNFFYPKELSSKDYFKFYSNKFDSVEINSTFYRLPSKKTLLKWKKESPKDFIFSIKASRYITHIKKLKDQKKSLSTFFNLIKILKPKLGPILFQLPNKWKINLNRLESFFKLLDKKYRYAIEFRDKSWITKETFYLLKKYKIAFCIYDLERFQTPLEVTSDFVYIRLHGPKFAYSGSYSNKELQKWAKIIKKFKKQKLDIYCYFNNDERAFAIKNALKLKILLSQVLKS